MPNLDRDVVVATLNLMGVRHIRLVQFSQSLTQVIWYPVGIDNPPFYDTHRQDGWHSFSWALDPSDAKVQWDDVPVSVLNKLVEFLCNENK